MYEENNLKLVVVLGYQVESLERLDWLGGGEEQLIPCIARGGSGVLVDVKKG